MHTLRLVLAAAAFVLLAACGCGSSGPAGLRDPLPPLAVHPSLDGVREGMSLEEFRALADEHWPAPSQPAPSGSGPERTDIFSRKPPVHRFTVLDEGVETLAVWVRPYELAHLYLFIFTDRRLARIVDPPVSETRTVIDEEGRAVEEPVPVPREEMARRALRVTPVGFTEFPRVATDRAWSAANAYHQHREPNPVLSFASAVGAPLRLLAFWRDDPEPREEYAEHLDWLARFDAAQIRPGDTRERVESLFGPPLASAEAEGGTARLYGPAAGEGKNQYGAVRVVVHFDDADRVTALFTEFETPWSEPELP